MAKSNIKNDLFVKVNQETLEATYHWKRAQEYPAISEQLDALFHAGVFPADMTAAIQAVKDAHPKP